MSFVKDLFKIMDLVSFSKKGWGWHNFGSLGSNIILFHKSDLEKLLKFEIEGREISKILRSLEHIFNLFNLFLEVSQI